jgi:hypothetical protein
VIPYLGGYSNDGKTMYIERTMTVQLKTLADFRRFLAQPGATIQVIRHDWADQDAKRAAVFAARPGFRDPRTVKKLQTNAVKFSNDSWLDWRSGASRFKFDGTDVVTVSLKDDFTDVMQYRCWITQPEEVS